MATRFYFAAVDAPAISPAFAAWDTTTDAVRRVLELGNAGSTLATRTINEPINIATNNLDYLAVQFVSDPLPAMSYTTSHTVKGQIRVSESNLAANFMLQCVVRVLDSDDTTILGTILAENTAALSSEFATTLTNRRVPRVGSPPTALAANVSAPLNHRLLVEVGLRANNTQTTARTASFRIGESAGADLAEDETTTTDNNPWIEFSFDYPIALPDAATGTIFASDTFTNTAGTSLNTHSADWDIIDASDVAVISDVNRVRHTGAPTTGNAIYDHDAVPSVAEYDVRSDVTIKSLSVGNAGVMGRSEGNTLNDAYAALLGGGSLFLYTPGPTLAGSVAFTEVDETSYALVLYIRDSVKVLAVNGVGYLSTANNTNAAAGTVGIVLTPAASGSNTTDYHLDNFEAQEVGALVLPAWVLNRGPLHNAVYRI